MSTPNDALAYSKRVLQQVQETREQSERELFNYRMKLAFKGIITDRQRVLLFKAGGPR